jgi:hypothetical protein
MEEAVYCFLCEKPMSLIRNRCLFLMWKKEKADYVCSDGHYICEDSKLAARAFNNALSLVTSLLFFFPWPWQPEAS